MSPTLVDPAELAAQVGPPEQLLVVLDFDGTLADLVDHPDDAALAAGAADALRRLTARTRVVVSSGRDVEDLRGRVAGLDVVLVSGHGAQIDDHGEVLAELVDIDAASRALDGAEERVDVLLAGRAGWIIERKPASLAVHHRMVSDANVDGLLAEVRATLDGWRGHPPGFEVLEGKSVLELRALGTDKGRALAWVLDHLDGRPPLVVGDDVTDEDAFEVANTRGGTSVVVAAADRTSAATRRVRSTEDVVNLLGHLADQPEA